MFIHRLKSLKVATILIAVTSISTTLWVVNQTSNATPPASTSQQVQPPPHSLPAERIPQADVYYYQKAARDIQRAREKAFLIQYLATQANSEPAADFVRLAQQTLSQAERSYQAGQFFAAEKQAKATNALYEAAKTLYEGQLGYTVGHRGPKAPGKHWYEAPYRAQERIARLEAEVNYYQVNNSTVTNLLKRAKQLAGSMTLVQTGQVLTSNNLATLANYRASEHLANAALHLIEMQQGFPR